MPFTTNKICSCCGIVFIPKQNHPRYKYCSSKCKDYVNKSKESYKQSRNAYMKQHREENLERYKERDKIYYLENKYKFLANNSRRRDVIKHATPGWANIDDIQNVYLEAQYFGYHVDHIIPLRGKNVSGLHVWDNLQILPPKDNLQKGNYHSVHEKWQERLSG